MSSEIFEIAQHKRLNWTTSIAMALFHLGAIAALFVFSWRNFWISVFLYWVATGLGISLGYHRLHTHRSYKAPRLLEYFFAVCGMSDTRRRSHLLGRHASYPSSKIRS